jgi:cardiolipin synthase
VVLFERGDEFFSTLFAAIDEARESIFLEFYIIRDDSLGQVLAKRLLAAARRGINVCVLYDYIGSFDTPNAYFRQLTAGGVRCCAFNPPRFSHQLLLMDRRNHRKVVIIDGLLAFTGGVNIGREYASGADGHEGWRDIGVRIIGPAVVALQAIFAKTWRKQSGELPALDHHEALPAMAGADEVLIVTGGPHHNRSRIRAAFRMAIAGASSRIVIANPYFIPGPRIIRSLLRAARRGVRVQIILPAVNDVPLVQILSRSTYAPLLKEGIEIYELADTVLHAKVMLINGHWSVIGSANLDQRSFHRNFELNVIISGVDFGLQVATMLARDIERSRPVQLDEHERRGWFVRALERILSIISWFL